LRWESADADLVYLRGFHNLTYLTLSNTKITDEGLLNLTDLPKLESLFLWGTEITDLGIAYLKELPRFADSRWQLDLRGTKVSKSALDELRRALPKMEIFPR